MIFSFFKRRMKPQIPFGLSIYLITKKLGLVIVVTVKQSMLKASFQYDSERNESRGTEQLCLYNSI